MEISDDITPDAAYESAKRLLEQRDPQTADAVALLVWSAARGHNLAAVALGKLWTESPNLTFSWPIGKQILSWLEAAAAKGHGRAQLYIGRMLRHGLGVNKDLSQARKRLESASSYLIVEAAFELAGMCECGEGMQPDAEQSLYWYAKAGDLGSFKLALAKTHDAMQLINKETLSTLCNARDLFRVSEKLGLHPAASMCAVWADAQRLLLQPASHACRFMAQSILDSLAEGDDSRAEEDAANLFDMVRRRAEQGEVRCWRILGRLYEIVAIGVENDEAAARAYQQGLKAGDRSAAVLLWLNAFRSGSCDLAISLWNGMKISLASTGGSYTLGENGEEIFIPPSQMVYSLPNLLPLIESNKFGLAEKLKDAIYDAYEGVNETDGEGYLNSSGLISLAGLIPSEALYCNKCGKTWSHDEFVPKVNNPVPFFPEGFISCPSGHEVVENYSNVIWD